MDPYNKRTVFKKLTSLLKEYIPLKYEFMPHDYIEMKIQKEPFKTTKSTATKFLLLMKHEELLNQIVYSFWNYYKLKPVNREYTMVLMFFIIFDLATKEDVNIFENLNRSNYRYYLNVFTYFTVDSNLVEITQIACKIYENDYVLLNILEPVMNKMQIIQNLCSELHNKTLEGECETRKPPTQPVEPSFMRRIRKSPPPPINTPNPESKPFKSRKVPTTVRNGSILFKKSVCNKETEDTQETREETSTKIAQVKENTSKGPALRDLDDKHIAKQTIQIFKAKAHPSKKNVNIKTTTATLMREAANLSKEQENEIKQINNILSGAWDPGKIVAFENEARYIQEQEELRDIERKHLKGMLSYEEAILAKKKLLKNNQEKMLLFRQEHEKILEEIGKWKKNEQIKIKTLVQKGQTIARAAKESEQQLLLRRQQNVKLTIYENRKLLNEAYKAREEELDRKVKLIQELRTLQQVQRMQVANKEFDRTECPNFGFLCEMSIAELQERLGLLKIQMQVELRERQEAISKDKERHRQFIKDTEEFVTKIRLCKSKVQLDPPLLKTKEQPSDLALLRDRLQLVRNMRLNSTIS